MPPGRFSCRTAMRRFDPVLRRRSTGGGEGGRLRPAPFQQVTVAPEPRAETAQGPGAPQGLLHAPDLLVDVAVAVVGVEDVLRAAVIGDVVRRHEMDARHVSGPRL